MAARALQRVNDELTDISYQVFPDIAWVYNKPLRVSGPKTSSDYQEIKEYVLNSPAVLATIKEIYNTSGIPLNKLRREALSMFNSLNTRISNTSTRSFAYIMRKFWRSAYDGIYINPDGLKRISTAQRKGACILLPTHKSHVDYIILSYLFYEYNIKIPRIIAGQNLDFFGVGTILKQAGAIWIRRSFSSDKLYQSVFKSYIHSLLLHNTMIECFIEGGRSRLGKVLTPKIGFLRTIVELLINDSKLFEKDISIIPISISYDKLMESSSFSSEHLGNEKQKESLPNLLNAVNNIMKLKFGSINVEIGEIYSLKKKILHHSRGAASTSTSTSTKSLKLNNKLLKNICLRIAHEQLYNMNCLTAVTISSIISTILLTEDKRRGITLNILNQKVIQLIRDIQLRNGKIVSYIKLSSMENINIIVDRALNVMNKLIINSNGIIMIYNDSSCLELSMYRNQLLHHFVHESLVSISILSIINNKFETEINKNDLMQSVQFLSKLLKNEFIYKPSVQFVDNFDNTLDFMISSQNILTDEYGTTNQDYIRINDSNNINDNIQLIQFLSSLIYPFIDTYYIISISLKLLLPNKILSQKEFVSLCSKNASKLYYSGNINYFECVSVHSLNNALNWFKSQRIIIHQSVEIGKSTFLTANRGKDVSVIQLSEIYKNIDSIQELISIINTYRKHNRTSITNDTFTSSSLIPKQAKL